MCDYIIKVMKKTFIFILFLIILLSGCESANTVPAVEASVAPASQKPEETFDEENASVEDALFLYGRSFLPPLEQQVYDELAEKAGQYDFDSNIPVPPQLEEYDVALLTAYFYYDYPQYYWAVLELTLDEATGARALRITAAEGLSAELVRNRQDEIDDVAKLFFGDIEGDVFETVVSVHDRLVEQVSRDSSFEWDSGNIYGALAGKKAICDGYAKAFQYLMSLKGIPCIYFQGESGNGTPHAWNAVYIEDGWYYVDVTWDALSPGRVLHTHLGITLEELLREREFSAEQYPEIVDADSTEYNYFYRKGFAVSQDDDSGTVRELAEAFVNGLSGRELAARESLQFLEIKVYAPPERYREIRDEFIQNPFLVLREMNRIALERNLPFEIATEGQINCNHKDLMQILILWPRVTKLDSD